MRDDFCACGLRLSVADPGNVCIHCRENPLPVEARAHTSPRKPCSRCRQVERVLGWAYCADCKRIMERHYYQRRRVTVEIGT